MTPGERRWALLVGLAMVCVSTVLTASAFILVWLALSLAVAGPGA